MVNNKSILIRQEIRADHKEVYQLVKKAFEAEAYADGDEQDLVERLRKSSSFIPELSLIAEYKKIVGHILLTKIIIRNKEQQFDALSLAPISVLPSFQKQGIGGKLIEEAHKIAKALGYKSVILIGHEKYYPRFGYELIRNYHIKLPFEAPEKNCMIKALVEGGLDGVEGEVIYPKAFFE